MPEFFAASVEKRQSEAVEEKFIIYGSRDTMADKIQRGEILH